MAPSETMVRVVLCIRALSQVVDIFRSLQRGKLALVGRRKKTARLGACGW